MTLELVKLLSLELFDGSEVEGIVLVIVVGRVEALAVLFLISTVGSV